MGDLDGLLAHRLDYRPDVAPLGSHLGSPVHRILGQWQAGEVAVGSARAFD